MPELPEVETTRRGIAPHVVGNRVARVVVRDRRLRWPVAPTVARGLTGAVVTGVERRAKYLLLRTDRGTAIVHLGMSGSLRIVPSDMPPFAHDHIDVELDGGKALRYTDPRRFGCWLWTTRDPLAHKLLNGLGPEPLGERFDGAHLHAASRGRSTAVKNLLMDGRVVVGVGNIYASEALWLAGIHPARAAGRVARARYDRLAAAVREVLEHAIGAGGTTLRDYAQSDGSPGYFRVKLSVYDRAGKPCLRCGTPIRQRVIGQRSSYFCPGCQR